MSRRKHRAKSHRAEAIAEPQGSELDQLQRWAALRGEKVEAHGRVKPVQTLLEDDAVRHAGILSLGRSLQFGRLSDLHRRMAEVDLAIGGSIEKMTPSQLLAYRDRLVEEAAALETRLNPPPVEGMEGQQSGVSVVINPTTQNNSLTVEQGAPGHPLTPQQRQRVAQMAQGMMRQLQDQSIAEPATGRPSLQVIEVGDGPVESDGERIKGRG